ncbi:MAG: adhesin, partial [Dehalococcoidia bacterium]|nr:adhesin [Dehalococcoidia bacterium]
MGLASVLFLSFFLIVSACSSDSSEEVSEEIAQEVKQLSVVTTIYPVDYYATRIGGEYV